MVEVHNALGNAPKDLVDRVNEYFSHDSPPVNKALADLNELVGFAYRLNFDWRE
jgi:hypothetical protein